MLIFLFLFFVFCSSRFGVENIDIILFRLFDYLSNHFHRHQHRRRSSRRKKRKTKKRLPGKRESKKHDMHDMCENKKKKSLLPLPKNQNKTIKTKKQHILIHFCLCVFPPSKSRNGTDLGLGLFSFRKLINKFVFVICYTSKQRAQFPEPRPVIEQLQFSLSSFGL
jgi:hypothetical protein